jgi:hypothetical protein
MFFEPRYWRRGERGDDATAQFYHVVGSIELGMVAAASGTISQILQVNDALAD